MALAPSTDPKTPAEVKVTTKARVPQFDPRVGVAVPAPAPGAAPRHRLVVVGDSLSHGFQSGAIFNTHLSFPMIIAWEMGWDASFLVPTYSGQGGLPLNIEYLVRRLERRFGDKVNWWELALAAFEVRQYMADVEDWWERGPGAQVPQTLGIMHNLSIYGWDLRDALQRTADVCAAAIRKPKNNILKQLVENANDRAALYVLQSARTEAGLALSPLGAAEELGRQGGIETLIVFLGANNALGSVVQLEVKWSKEPDYTDLDAKGQFTVWNPDHFAKEFRLVADAVRRIDAKHVILGTVPHVTIAPIARGVGRKVRPDSRYFPYYTRPWIGDSAFNPKDDPSISEAEARAIDSAIDQYNDFIVAQVEAARTAGKDWYVLDVAGLLDRLAHRRYIESPEARPDWWTPYELPAELAVLGPLFDSRFFASGPRGRIQGGLFALDGVHPTTVGYGILAQEFINVMQLAGVPFYYGDGTTRRTGPLRVDFRRLLLLDTLMSDPPRSLSSDLALIGWVDQKIDFLRRIIPRW